MSFPRYPAYKDSGVEWLGEVPEHWEVKSVRRIFKIKKRISGELGFDILSITQQGIKVRDPDSNDGQVSMDYSKYQIVEPGDFAMNHMDLLTGFVDISTSLGVTSPDYRVFSIAEPGGSCPGYLLYIFQMGYKQKILYAYGQGSSQLGRWRLPTEQFQDWAIPFPSLEEQISIATFLDRETAKIDALIAEQQRLIELLQEKRQSVISHAVTKGLNPNAPMKASGVEWLGEVPEHWNILPVWMLFFIGRGRVISHEDIASSPGDYPVYSSQTEQDGEMGRIDTFDFEGDYLTWTTDGANAGSVFRRAGRFNCTNVCGTLKSKPNALVILEFAVQSLRLATASFVRMDINPKLMNNVMASIKIPVPPLEEQQSIALHISQHTEEFEPLKAAIDIQLQLLKERRSALISAAVTGQIDVRGLVTEEGEQ
jgi:type I restriction enzyme, S subunit